MGRVEENSFGLEYFFLPRCWLLLVDERRGRRRRKKAKTKIELWPQID